MTSNPTVNRYLKDKAFDNIDHALGRPVDPMAETYRNHYACEKGGVKAAAFKKSRYWRLTSSTGNMSFYSVTDAGRMALGAHLKEIGDQWGRYSVTWNDETCIIAAISEDDAKKRAYDTASEFFSDLTFRQFGREVSVSRAAA